MKFFSIILNGLLIGCSVLFFSSVSPDAAFAKKARTIKVVFGGITEGAPENSAEIMGMNMYLGALDYRIRTFHVLKDKYRLKWVTTLFDNANDCLMGVSMGAAQMTFSGPHFLEQLSPEWKVVEAPGIFDGWDHFLKTMDTKPWKALHEKMASEKGVRILKWIANIGDWYLYTNKGPIKTIADLAGQKIRFPGGEAFANALKNMGTTPISLPYTEVVTGLQTHMIDGLLTDYLAAMYFYNLPDYTRYATDVVWAIQPICFVVNAKWWDSLPDKERQAMQDVFDRIDTSGYFQGVQNAIAAGWDQNPKTERIRFDPAQIRKWKQAMRKGSESILKSMDPQFIKAIEAARE